MRGKTQTLSEALMDMRINPGTYRPLVHNWRETLPPGSLWQPGFPGKPTCTTCHGLGYLRFDHLPVGSPNFGKLVICDCVPEPLHSEIAARMDSLRGVRD